MPLTVNDIRAARLLALGVLGFRADGRPIYPIGGGADDTGSADTGSDGGQDAAGGKNDADSGADASKNGSGDSGGSGSGGDGKQDADTDDKTDWKAEARKHEARARSNATKAAEFDKLKAASASDLEKAVEAGKAEVRSQMLADRVADKVEVAVAGRFIDDEAAAALLLRQGTDGFIDDGKVDADAIKKSVTALLKDRPHMAKNGDGTARGDVDQGRRGAGKNEPTDLESAIAQAFATN